MNESLLEDETLTTADIARPAAPLQEPAMMDRNRDQAQQTHTHPIPLPASTNSNPITDVGPLFPDDELNNFRARWTEVQTSFVDEPRHAVEQADSLVANVVKRIAEQFAAEGARWKISVARATTSPPRIFVNRSSATGPSLIACSPSRPGSRS